MTINEIKRTKTIEEVVSTEYIAYDGEIFSTEKACKDYEQSAYCVVKNKLNRIADSELDSINDEGCCDFEIEIFDIPTADDLDKLKQYVQLKLMFENPNYMTVEKAAREVKGLNSLTYGHEVLIIWNYDSDGVWCYGDGSAEAYGNYFKNQYLKLMERARERAKAEANN